MFKVGEVYKGWRVIGMEKNAYNQPVWSCKCECCGMERTFQTNQLKKRKLPCDCQRKVKIRNPTDRRLYHVHYEMTKDRSDVEVCDEWQDFFTFRDWALANGYEQGKRIHRLHLDEPYSPDNVEIRAPIKRV